MIVPHRYEPHGDTEEPWAEVLGTGEVSTLEMTDADKKQARKRELSKQIGFAPPKDGARGDEPR